MQFKSVRFFVGDEEGMWTKRVTEQRALQINKTHGHILKSFSWTLNSKLGFDSNDKLWIFKTNPLFIIKSIYIFPRVYSMHQIVGLADKKSVNDWKNTHFLEHIFFPSSICWDRQHGCKPCKIGTERSNPGNLEPCNFGALELLLLSDCECKEMMTQINKHVENEM